MTYTPKAWATGDAVAVADLLHLDSQYAAIGADLVTHVATGHPAVYRPKTDCDSYFWNANNDGAARGLNADTLSGQHAAAISGGVASGIMFWWYPGNGALPAGYLFADGGNGTYDMRNRYPIGASGTLAVGSTVGNATITAEGAVTVGACTLTVANIFHTHALLDIRAGSSYNGFDNGARSCRATLVDSTGTTDYQGSGNSHTHTGTFAGDSKSLDPLFQYLVIIQKS